MTRMIYIGNIRLPTEKAHGLQIMQNCEAFADVGADVSLWVTNRINTAVLAGIRDVWAHYGVRQGDLMKLRVGGDAATTFERVHVRIDPSSRLDVHMDTDEANACGLAHARQIELFK